MSEVPYVYLRFEKVKPDGGKVRLRIQDMRPCDVDSVLEFMGKWFLNEEAFTRAAGVLESKESTAELGSFNEKILRGQENHCLLCCIDHEDAHKVEIIAANIFYVESKEDCLLEKETDNLAKLFVIIGELLKVNNVLEKLNLESCFGGAGLSVDPSYRGCGIATELLLARRPMLQRRGIQLAYAWFTSAASQRAARKAGHVEVAELSFEELGRRAGVTFTDVPETLKLMIVRAKD